MSVACDSMLVSITESQQDEVDQLEPGEPAFMCLYPPDGNWYPGSILKVTKGTALVSELDLLMLLHSIVLITVEISWKTLRLHDLIILMGYKLHILSRLRGKQECLLPVLLQTEFVSEVRPISMNFFHFFVLMGLPSDQWQPDTT